MLCTPRSLMQSLSWYFNRLRRMSPSELAWRIRSAARDAADRHRIPSGRYPSRSAGLGIGLSGFSVSDVECGEWRSAPGGSQEALWREALREGADRICDHQLTFLGLTDCNVGSPVAWHREHSIGLATPVVFAPQIDYRDARVVGDCKLVWEPNRHHHLVVLGRAYRATGDVRYAREVTDQIDSWLTACPFGYGMNWRSPLELAIRVINWVWALDLIAGAPVLSAELRDRVLHAVYLHVWDISRKYSRWSSANNHTIGEAAGVFIATSYFRGAPAFDAWRDEAHQILSREIVRQTYADGCTREQAFGYHLFVVQFFLLAGLVARRTGTDFSTEYWNRLEKMIEFAAALAEGGETVPMFGDSDDGYVLDLGGRPGDPHWLLDVGAVLFERPDFRHRRAPSEPVRWLLGRDGQTALDRLPAAPCSLLTSRAFPESGHYLLQTGHRGEKDSISVVFDCGELGFGTIAAHGHADALSITLRAFGKDVLVDPGTYDYFTYPEWREYFRSTRAHNTVVIDGADQSQMLGPFMWGHRADTQVLEWQRNAGGGGRIAAEHDGYMVLPGPARHHRRVELDSATGTVTLVDRVISAAKHRVTLWFHLAEHCEARRHDERGYIVTLPGGSVIIEFDPAVENFQAFGSFDPIGGWVSRGYHIKEPAATIGAELDALGDTTITTRIRIVAAPESESVEYAGSTGSRT